MTQGLAALANLRVSLRLLGEVASLVGGDVWLFGPRRVARHRAAGPSGAMDPCFASTGWPPCLEPDDGGRWHACGAGRGRHLVVPIAGARPHGWLVAAAVDADQLPAGAAECAARLCSIAADEMCSFREAGGAAPDVDLPEIVGVSAAIEAVREEIRRTLGAPFPVLIEGETGVGKDLAAWCIHHYGPRKEGRYVVVNCAAMPETLFESTLFGHRKGAFTGADRDHEGLLVAARGGTLFLDEIAELSLAAQAKLLRAIETGEVLPVGATRVQRTDARVLAATNADLEVAVRERRFRADLLYRLRVLSVHVPPLRERREDIPLLADHVLRQVRERLAVLLLGFTDAARAALVAAPWPGNVRELIHEIERAAVRCRGTHIDVEHLSPRLCVSQAGAPEGDNLLARGRAVGASWEREQLARVLAEEDWIVARAATVLGVSRRTVFNRIKQYGLERPKRT